MNMWQQIGFGSIVLTICVGLHVVVLGLGVAAISAVGESGALNDGFGEAILLIGIAASVVLFGQTLQVWIFAITFRAVGALSKLSDAVYFALVTTTTLGYGDVTLAPQFRIFGAMAAVNGLMTYGLSIAFLVGVAGGVLTSLI